MKHLITIILTLIVFCSLSGQEGVATMNGVVTFKASKNIYVRFSNTDEIRIGDTLYTNKNGIISPCMKVSKKSSSSCICLPLFDCSVDVEDVVIYIESSSIW